MSSMYNKKYPDRTVLFKSKARDLITTDVCENVPSVVTFDEMDF